LKCVTTSGKEFPVELNLSPINTDEGKSVAIVVRDISIQLQQQEDRLARATAEEANRAKSAFLATMSHEIRTPMNGVLGSAELLTRMSLENEQKELVRTIHESGSALLHIIDEILDFSKIEVGKLIVERNPVQFEQLCESVCHSLIPVAIKKRVKLTLFYDPGLPENIYSDSVRLRQILNNLISNALKFSEKPEGGDTVTVRVESEGNGRLKLSVSDNGIGMSEEHQQTICAPFTQEEAYTTKRFGGTGLSLTICKHVDGVVGRNNSCKQSH